MAKQVPIAIPQVKDAEDLRRHVVKHLTDVSRKIAQSDQRTAPMDMGQNRVMSVADPANPTDAVNLRTLKKHIDEVANTPRRAQSQTGANSAAYAIVFSAQGTLVAGQICPPYIVGPHRTGRPYVIKAACVGTGTGNCSMNIIHVTGTTTTTFLATNIVIPAGSTGPITSMVWSTPTPTLDIDDMIRAVVSTSGGVSNVTIQLEVTQ